MQGQGHCGVVTSGVLSFLGHKIQFCLYILYIMFYYIFVTECVIYNLNKFCYLSTPYPKLYTHGSVHMESVELGQVKYEGQGSERES